MTDLEQKDIKKFLEPPFTGERLNEKARRYKDSFDHLLSNIEIPPTEDLEASYNVLESWLKYADNQKMAAQLIQSAVNLIRSQERDILSESHDLFHLTEMATGLLDDKNHGVETENATVLLTIIEILLHDIGRHTEKILTDQQLDLSAGLHHDIFTYRSARKILKLIGKETHFPQQIQDSFSQLVFTGLRKFGKVGVEQFFAIANDTDRRQILGSPTVGRDILYFGGMEGKDLTPGSIINMPPGYTHYDSGGFFGQQNTMSRAVFRDEAIRQNRFLDQVFDELAVQATTITLLACGNNQELINRAFDVDLGLIATPSERLTNEQGPWWPKKPLPSPQILTNAQNEKQKIEQTINPEKLSLNDLHILVETFLTAYSTIIESAHLQKVKENMSKFSPEDRINWARILFYAHRKNQERYDRRLDEFSKEDQYGTFMAKVLKPFIEILENKKEEREKVESLF